MAVRLQDGEGRAAGIALIYKPAASMAVLSTLAGSGDLRHFERMHQVAQPCRRPSAVLFADLEASSALARRLSTASYFSLGRRLARAADQCVIDANDEVLAFVGVNARGRASGAGVSYGHGQLWTVHDGLVVRMRLFGDREAALRAAGLTE